MITFGDPALPVRFWSKVREDESGCWLWIRPAERNYAQFWLDGRHQTAHRVTYEAFVGPVPPYVPGGFHIDHLCRQRLCVRPDHLELVTTLLNVARAHEPVAVRMETGKCINGHDEWKRSSHSRPPTSHRCAECHRERGRRQSRLVVNAAHSLGMTKRQYVGQFGASTYTALRILGEA